MASITLELTREENKSNSDELCSICSSTGHFACVDHCNTILCAKCTQRHRADVIQKMREHLKRLQIYQSNFVRFLNSSRSNSSQTSNILEENLNELNSEQTSRQNLINYLKMLDENLRNDKLIHEKILADIETYFGERTILLMRDSRSVSNRQEITIRPLSSQQSPIRSSSATVNWSKIVTTSIGVQKSLTLQIEPSFSMGPHPVVVSLNENYIETSFFQWRENSVVLLSLLSVDIYMRGAGLVWSIPYRRILGNTKDNILAGIWCFYAERLILVGRYHFYIFDLDRKKVRCICKCGCGARSCNGPMRPKPPIKMAPRYRCQHPPEEYIYSRRYIATNHRGLLFYAYKCETGKYQLETYPLSRPPKNINESQAEELLVNNSNRYFDVKEMKPNRAITIDGHLSAMCVTHNCIALVYRRFKPIENIKNKFEIEHYIITYDHSLTILTNEIRLSASVRWITGIAFYGTEYEFLLCDPRSQQLLVYHTIHGSLIRRFRIGPVNACCLNDGRLVLWIKKAYCTTPIGKLHFISPPHLTNFSSVSNSFELLKT